MTPRIERKTCRAQDGVRLVYSMAGSGEPALLFVHGGLANRGFWDGELAAFSGRHTAIAIDLPGHGESGMDRRKWGMVEFGADVRTVVEAEKIEKVVLFGNSLGGPVVIEAALQMPGKVLGVVGVDTFHSLEMLVTPEEATERALAFRSDYAGSVRQMVRMLFHPDADPALVADAERRMMGTPPDAAYEMFLSFGGYDGEASVRALAAPLRAINGDLYPTDVQANRRINASFDAAVMKHVGHYPMLERPAEFDRLVQAVVVELSRPDRHGPS